MYKLADDMLRYDDDYAVRRDEDYLFRKLPKDYAPHEVKEAMTRLGGPLPMNIFLR